MVEAEAVRILERAEAVRSPDLDYAVEFTLLVENPTSDWKRRTAAYSMIAHGKDATLVLMREPALFHPGTLLIDAGRYWLLLPRSSMPLELSARNVLDGDIANGDLARGNLLADFQPRLVGTGPMGGEECHQLELLRLHARALYPRIVCWIGRRDFRPLRFDYYGQTGELLRVVSYEDFRPGRLGLRASRLVVDNRLRPGERTTLTFTDLRPIRLRGLRFDLPGLIAFRDAAQASFDGAGRQASVDAILTALARTRP